jgi:hypothetical protein
MATKDRAELAIFLITMILTVVEDLLIGVISGFVAALIRLLCTLTYLGVKKDGNNQISFIGNASFLRLPQLDRIIRDTNNFGDELIVDMTGVVHMDHAFAEAIRTWKNRIISSGKNMVIILPPSGFLHLSSLIFLASLASYNKYHLKQAIFYGCLKFFIFLHSINQQPIRRARRIDPETGTT